MQIGKFYTLKKSCIEAFLGEDGTNHEIMETMKEHNMVFEVLDINSDYVDKVRFMDGYIADCNETNGADYFELRESEQWMFEEVEGWAAGLINMLTKQKEPAAPETITESVDEGVKSIHMIVTQDNHKEMIELINKSFN